MSPEQIEQRIDRLIRSQITEDLPVVNVSTLTEKVLKNGVPRLLDAPKDHPDREVVHHLLRQAMNGCVKKFLDNKENWRQYTPEEAQALVQEWQRTTLSVKAFSEAKGIPTELFCTWMPLKPHAALLERSLIWGEEWRRSGLSKKAFAASKGIRPTRITGPLRPESLEYIEGRLEGGKNPNYFRRDA